MHEIKIDPALLTTAEEREGFEDQLEDIRIKLNAIVGPLQETTKKLKNEKAKIYFKGSLLLRVTDILFALNKIFKIYPPLKKRKIKAAEGLELRTYLSSFIGNLYGFYEGFLWTWYYEKCIFRDIDPDDFKYINPFAQKKVSKQKKDTAKLLKYEKDLEKRVKFKNFIRKHERWYANMRAYRDFAIHQLVLNVYPVINNEKKEKTFLKILNSFNDCADFDRFKNAASLHEKYFSLRDNDLFYTDLSGQCEPAHLHRQVLKDTYVLLDFLGFLIEIFDKK